MKVKTKDLEGAALDWITAIATGLKPEDLYINDGGGKEYTSIFRKIRDEDGNLTGYYMTGPDLLFSHKWEAAGPIIERYSISVDRGIDSYVGYTNRYWWAEKDGGTGYRSETRALGTTYLEAAMRCYVTSKLGEEVEIPEGLL